MHIIADVNKISKTVAVLVCLTMRERARVFLATIYVQLFDVAFSIKKFSFFGALVKRILAWKRNISKN